MKIDKKNVRHWRALFLFGMNVVIAIILRHFRGGSSKRHVILYGHKLSGNLLALYQYVLKEQQNEFEFTFLTMDVNYHRALKARGIASVSATSVEGMLWLVRADAVISDHGLHVMSLMLMLSNLRFFDVWHGIPFKGFDADDFRAQHRYDECWVPSPLLRNMYVERFGFKPDRVIATGYARTDLLVNQDRSQEEIKRRLGLMGVDIGKIVLFAPTWKQDAQQRSLFPFGMDEQSFFRCLSEMATLTGSTFVMRAHLNSGDATEGAWPRIVQLPYAKFPDTEALLLVSDILVCDWSSIAFDFLLLDRPAIFLDVAPPFAKGFSLDASYRFGPVVDSMPALLQLLLSYLEDPSRYLNSYLGRAKSIRAEVYGELSDGKSAARCIDRLRTHLK